MLPQCHTIRADANLALHTSDREAIQMTLRAGAWSANSYLIIA